MKGGTLARLAGQLCQQQAFREFCHANSADAAAQFIRSTCGVQSRAELDHNEDAARRFHEQVRRPYAYRNGDV